MARVRTLEQAFVEEIRDLYDAEKQLTRALPKLAKGANSEDLREAFREHLEVTKGQVARLEQVFEMIDQKARSKTCKAMRGLVEEGQEQLETEAQDVVKDLLLIGAAQKVEHYEISGYGTARTMAQQLGQPEAAGLLEETLKEEEMTDKKLTQIAKVLYRDVKKDGRPRENGGGGGSRGRAASGHARTSNMTAVAPNELDFDQESDE
jgi:ferritin-like metal-binding protein YciE